MKIRAVSLVSWWLLAAGCGDGGQGSGEASTSASDTDTDAGESGPTDSGDTPATDDLYSSAIATIVLEVDYAPGAEPYTGSVIGFGDVWDVFVNNVDALFAGGEKMLEVPRTLDQMELLPDVAGDSFDYAAIKAIAAAHRDTASEGDTASFYAVWLPGYYDDGKMVRKDVLGVSFRGTGILAMFKPVIAGTGALGTEKLVEQVTLVHEFGHLAGLVNNGLAMHAPHQDEPHGKHCSNKDCLMYYTVESTQDVLGFVTSSLTSNTKILWGDECLADAADAIAAGG